MLIPEDFFHPQPAAYVSTCYELSQLGDAVGW
jgi:hypothetical protein